MNPGFIRKMPSLRQCAKMKDVKVYKSLSIIPSSDFYGVKPSVISQNVCYNDAVRHLNDLVLVNAKSKSNLFLVSEKSFESASIL